MDSLLYIDPLSISHEVKSFGSANGINDASSRVESMKFSAEGFNLVDYQYLGSSGFVSATSAQPGISWTLIGSGNDPNTGDIYWGLDRFGRVDNCLWKTSSATLAPIEYGYDRASNRTWRKDGVLTGYDELYSYDGLYRLTDQQRGTLNGTQTAITSGTFQQQWGLDATGNWKTFKQDNDGNGTWEVNQTRTANKVNEITGITNSVGSAWATPSYDRAGNMVGIPNPPATTTGTTPAWNPFTESQWNSFTEAQWNAFTLDSGTVPTQLSARYDAWNRLVEIRNGATTLVENVYDARGYRIRKDTYVTGTLSESRHYYYTPGWQCVEECIGSTSTAERQFVWGLRYIDDLILRDRSTANNGTMNERRYGMQDGNWNMIAICDTTGAVTERFAYSAYGAPVFMTGAGTVQTSSASGFETLYAGYRWDGESPLMHYVRNRFLLPAMGTWNRRDPLGYVDGMGLYSIYFVISRVDPFGLDEGQSHHWIDKPHVGNLADLCGDLLEQALTTADEFREMLTTWLPGGWSRGEPHTQLHFPVDDVDYIDALDNVFGDSENCCEAMVKLKQLISDRYRELTLGEGSQGPVRPRFGWYPSDPFCPLGKGAHIDTSHVLDLFVNFACRMQPLPRRTPIWQPVTVTVPVSAPVSDPMFNMEPVDVYGPLGVGIGLGVIWKGIKAVAKSLPRTAGKCAGFVFGFLAPPGSQYDPTCEGPRPLL